jgi:hypothetical protein
MTKLLSQINSVDWQPKKGAIGEIVEGIDDIKQCIENILQTPKGSVPHNPEFGSDAWKYIDAPVNVAIPNIIRETIDAINMWETRVEVSTVDAEIDGSHVIINLSWKLQDSDIEESQEVKI